ncbi:uncharacterized protein RB166_017995 [Leptodactylus fuscus]
MARALLLSLFAVMCLMCFSEVQAEDCAAFVNDKVTLVPYQSCPPVITSCGGTCTNRYCILGGSLDQSQFMCIVTNLYFIIGVSIFFLILLICSIVASCWKCCIVASFANSMI